MTAAPGERARVRCRLAFVPAAAPLALAVVAVLALAGCGNAASQRRLRLAAYLQRVQRVETEMKQPLAAVGTAGRRLVGATGSLSPAVAAGGERTLRASISRQRALGAELASMPAPPEAAHLRTLLQELAGRQLSLTRELAAFVSFAPRLAVVMRSLGPATQRLQRVLAARGTYAAAAAGAVYVAKARALRSFQTAVDEIAARLVRLRPPAVSAPAWRTQLCSLRAMGAAAGDLAVRLGSGRPDGIPQLLLAFDRAATLSRTVAAQRAQIAAVHAYTREVRSIDRLVAAIDLERARLDRTAH